MPTLGYFKGGMERAGSFRDKKLGHARANKTEQYELNFLARALPPVATVLRKLTLHRGEEN